MSSTVAVRLRLGLSVQSHFFNTPSGSDCVCALVCAKGIENTLEAARHGNEETGIRKGCGLSRHEDARYYWSEIMSTLAPSSDVWCKEVFFFSRCKLSASIQITLKACGTESMEEISIISATNCVKSEHTGAMHIFSFIIITSVLSIISA